MIGIKVPSKMKEALQKAAENKFQSMSGYIKAACEKALQEDGIDWKAGKAKPQKK
jgi:predicted DNA-binding protein